MKLLRVDTNSDYYLQGVSLRKKLFFNGYENAQQLIDDDFEINSVHIVALKNEIVIGTGRLTFVGKTAIISQMTVHPKNQNTGIGSNILKKLIQISELNKPLWT